MTISDGEITSDGERSKSKKWFAEKQVNIIKEIDVPAKTIKWDGFTFSVWQKENQSGGHISSPMGLVAMCSTQSGIKIAEFENWLGGCTLYGDYHVMFNPGYRASVRDVSAEDMTAAGFQTLKSKPVIEQTYCDNGVDTPFLVDSFSCTPAIMPFKGSEAYNITVTDDMFIDFNNNGLPDYPYPLTDSSLVPYSSNGNFLGGRRTNSLASGANDMRKTCQNLSDGTQLCFPEGYLDLVDGQFVCADIIDGDTISQILLSDVVPESPEGDTMPVELRGYMLDINISIIRPCGFYGFTSTTGERIFVSSLFFDPLAVPIGGPDGTISGYFSSNPSQEHWRAFLSVMAGDTVYLVHSGQFFSLLETLVVNPLTIAGVTQWDRVGAILKYLFPYPNLPGRYEIYFAWKPHDSVMFHGEDNAVYTWTRIGSVKFDTTGITAASITVPSEVTGNPGTRPDITHAGSGTYICICNNLEAEVSATYYGTPFGSWANLPDVPEYCTLMHARPVVANDTGIVLLGIVECSPPDVTPVYRIAILRYDYSIGEWNLAGTLPFQIGTTDNLSLCLYGNGKFVKNLIDYPSPPASVPQNIVVPYEGYAKYRP